ncbi:hypothetical protein JAAARDRAFT_38139 [Jaapia argillacea MUCL 33604]|uniref:Amidohydrolase 3 domain-containing protein n=1 Tax=Jaapia argillacea MUCL 33604 TaxID=933084 RepID=A0A067PKW5_9AGAM|nr:hypothetical protein JAAARDRAFT_38139 [Jaapia argillacea MUCL 33604]
MDEKQPLLPPSPNPATRWTLFAAVLVSVLVIWLTRTDDVPGTYAVCSKTGVYTVHEGKAKVDCLLVAGDTIVQIGTRKEILDAAHSLSRNKLTVFDLQPGNIVVPGLADSHAHLLEYGFTQNLPLGDATSIKEIISRLESYILSHPDILNDNSTWIQAWGWDQNKWEDLNGGFPTASDLTSPLLNSRPISLSRIDGHASWVSPRVLEIMKEQHRIPPPGKVVPGGQVIRDSDGNPTGIFVDSAQNLIPLPPRTYKQMKEWWDVAMRDALSVGLTSVHDAGLGEAEGEFYKRMAEEGNMPIRVYGMTTLSPSGSVLSPRLINWGKHGRLNIRSVKMFFDGALGSWGAALLSPYTDKPDTSGILIVDPKKMRKDVRKVWGEGWQVNIHCIGDKANKLALDIFEELLSPPPSWWDIGSFLGGGTSGSGNASERRPRIEHAQIMRVEDLGRIGRLGVIASVQPTHATSDMWYAEDRLGAERIKGAYAYQTLLQNSPNTVLPLGSDFPVEGINPLLGFYAAVARLDGNGQSPHGPGGWYSNQSLTRSQALKGMTLDAAYASFAENEIGSLTPGKKADFVVLDRDIMDEEVVRVGGVLEGKVRATVVDGRVAFGGF